MTRFDTPCRSPSWARSGHAQTIFGHILPSRGAPIVGGAHGWKTLEVQTEDNERLCVLLHAGHTGVRILLMHGLSGDANSDYMRRTAAALLQAGHEVWAINHRGCGAGRTLAREPYHSGKTEDLRALLKHSQRVPGADMQIVIGFSLSGNLALLYAGQNCEPAPDAIIAVNPPVDLLQTSIEIGRGFNRIYELRFMHRLLREVRERNRAGLAGLPPALSRWSSLIEFDDLFTAPACGFESGRDYYEKCSAVSKLRQVQIPTVIIATEDDPFVPISAFEGAQTSKAVFLHRERWGGHVGYVSRRWHRGERWLDAALLHYVAEFA